MFALYGDKSTYVHSSLLSTITYHSPEERQEIRQGVMQHGALAHSCTVACIAAAAAAAAVVVVVVETSMQI